MIYTLLAIVAVFLISGIVLSRHEDRIYRKRREELRRRKRRVFGK